MKVELGKILKPQGIKGELKVQPLSNPDYLKSIQDVTLNGQPVKIEKCSIREGYAYIMLNICKDRNTAETLRDAIISVDKESLPDLDEGQYFYEDLIGCQIYDEANNLIGEILDIENYGSADIFVIKQGFTTIDCPFVDGVFKAIDTKQKKVIVDKQKFTEVTDYEN